MLALLPSQASSVCRSLLITCFFQFPVSWLDLSLFLVIRDSFFTCVSRVTRQGGNVKPALSLPTGRKRAMQRNEAFVLRGQRATGGNLTTSVTVPSKRSRSGAGSPPRVAVKTKKVAGAAGVSAADAAGGTPLSTTAAAKVCTL